MPGHIDDNWALEQIDPAKDADGLHPVNLGLLVMGVDAPVACTPAGIQLMLADAGIAPSVSDQVFITGGSSPIPAVRQVFAHRFGADKLAYGDEFVSIAAGMSLLAATR